VPILAVFGVLPPRLETQKPAHRISPGLDDIREGFDPDRLIARFPTAR
jgi:hypothetical protein